MVRAAEKTYEARALEARVAAHWKEHDAYRALKRAREHAKPFYFLDGPPYATGHIHIGTARNKVLKDAFVRHMRMKGFNVRDQPGYDMHGLPIEVKVEQELGFKTKKDIEAYGIDRFVEACRHFATQHLKVMSEEFKELGVWMDWDHPYMTVTNEYIEGAWWSLEKAHERGLLFKSERVLTWCRRCETALANAEVEHEEREDPSAYVKFPVEGREREHLVIWTTTPWTLPANVAIAAHPDLEYARIRVTKEGREEVLVVAAEQAENVARIGRYDGMLVLERMPGRSLEGLRYVHPFQQEVPFHRTPASDWNNRVILGTHVAADRTGLVHTATGHGVEDFEAGRKYGIPVFSPVGEDGRYTEAAGALAGLAVKSDKGSEADERVLELLRVRNLLLAHRMEKHSYGHCWRCKNPILFRATTQWFIDVPKIKDKMISETKRVKWTPDWAGSHRQLDWVDNARDWCISRQRYWGIPLPIWTCTANGCDETVVIGSRRELHHVSDYKPGGDLHRPWIDKVRVVCPRRGCGGLMKRVPDVLDVWYDSAVAAWSTLHWPGHKKDFETWFPARWICEGLDQTRGWFYSQLAAGVAAMDRVPYEEVVMHGWVNDAQGRPMSKSLGNIVKPGDVIAKFGADSFRLGLLGGAAPWEDVSFGTENVRAAQRTLNILWNVHVFATQYMAADGYRHDGVHKHDSAFRPEDRWLLSRLQSTVADATHALDAMEFHKAVRHVEAFILEDLSRWYVRLVRERVWDESASADKEAAYAVLHESLTTVARLLAPFAPHVAEALHQDLTDGAGRLSVHMDDWPVADGALTDYDLERDMATLRAAVEAAAYARQKANMKLRWPVARLTFATDDPDVRGALTRFRETLLEQANAKDVEIVGGEWEKLNLAAVPNKNFIGRTFRQDGPKILRRLADLDQPALRALRAALQKGERPTLEVEGGLNVELTGEVVSFETRLPADLSGADFPGGSVYVETVVTDELKAEGAARDLTRRIQETRKLAGLAMQAQVRTQVSAPADLAALVAPHVARIAADTRSVSFDFVEKAQGDTVREWDLEDAAIVVGLREDKPVLTPVGLETPNDAPPSAAPPAAKPRKAKKAAPKKAAAKKAPAKKPAKAARKAPAKKAPAKKNADPKKAVKKAPAAKPSKKAAKKAAPKKAAAKGKARKGGARRS